jgi:hypothetical protein
LLGSRTFLGTIARRRRTCPSSTPTAPPGIESSSSAYVILAHLGWGAAEEGLQGLRWSDRPDGRCPGPVDVVRSCHRRCPRTTGAPVPVLPRPGLLADAATTGLRCQPGDEVVRPFPGCFSTRCATSAA